MLNWKGPHPRALYIHWPFCRSKCAYCPFVSQTGTIEQVNRYYRALVREIQQYAQQFEPITLETVYLGGGTPSLCPPELLLDMFGILKKCFLFTDKCETSIEINPGTVTLPLMHTWQTAGINRASIGVQTIYDDVLLRLNRRQKAEQVRWLMTAIPSFFDNVSVDVIVGLPGVTTPMWRTFISELATWPIAHVSLYFLTLHTETPLYAQVQNKAVILPDEDEVVDQYQWAAEFLDKQGIKRYEISNFARPGQECRHNQIYWERAPFKGCGAAAWSFDGHRRLQNESKLTAYVDASEREMSVITQIEKLSPTQIWHEELMLGLRQTRGCFFETTCRGLTISERMNFQQRVSQLANHGLVNLVDGWLRLTDAGMLVEQEITVQLSQAVLQTH